MNLIRQARKLTSETHLRFERQGIREAIAYASAQTHNNFIMKQIFGKEMFEGILPYDREWDLLIVLDACRADLFREITNGKNYDFIEQEDEVISISGKSLDWMRAMFDQSNSSEVKNTAYVTANPHTEIVLQEEETVEKDDFETIDEVWKYGWDEQVGTVLAETITDRAIDIGRSSQATRVIIHYMQPHFPSVPNPDLGSQIELDVVGDDWPSSIWERCLRGEVTKDEVWDAYVENAKYVMESVELLLSNFDAEDPIITADHGNALGEKGFYGHGGYPVREVWEVPWCRVSSKDEGNYQPKTERPNEPSTTDVESRLKSLGYMD
ncbi:hypothetical protein [Haladaptatus sp. NG-SE-30]